MIWSNGSKPGKMDLPAFSQLECYRQILRSLIAVVVVQSISRVYFENIIMIVVPTSKPRLILHPMQATPFCIDFHTDQALSRDPHSYRLIPLQFLRKTHPIDVRTLLSASGDCYGMLVFMPKPRSHQTLVLRKRRLGVFFDPSQQHIFVNSFRTWPISQRGRKSSSQFPSLPCLKRNNEPLERKNILEYYK